MLASMAAFYCVLGIVYTGILTLCSFGRGVIYMWFWSIILLWGSFYLGWWETNIAGVYLLNTGNGIPDFIFSPEILISAPIIATILRFSVFAQKRDNQRRANSRV